MNIKDKILANQFIDKVRVEMVIDDESYEELVELLKLLSKEWKDKSVIDKELALVLYSIPQMIRNSYLSFEDGSSNSEKPEIAQKLEDIWIDLDALVIECLT